MREIVETGLVDDIFYRCRHPYTEALERSIPQMSEVRANRLVAIEGNPPNPLWLPPGCAFAPRCRYRLDVAIRASRRWRRLRRASEGVLLRRRAGIPAELATRE